VVFAREENVPVRSEVRHSLLCTWLMSNSKEALTP
jgi:hypothetical protein